MIERHSGIPSPTIIAAQAHGLDRARSARVGVSRSIRHRLREIVE
jgi:hypothetical protein